MPEIDGSRDGQGDERRAQERVGDAAMMLEGGNRPGESPQHVEIGGFGCQRHRQGGVGGAAIEAAAGEDGSGEKVGDWFHLCCLMRDYRVRRTAATDLLAEG